MKDLKDKNSFQQITRFLKPRAIAVVGASSRSGQIGYVILENLSRAFKGFIFPVNPTRKSILGFEVYPSINAVPKDVDLIVAIIDLKQIPDLIEQSAKKGTQAVVIVSGGGKELGGEHAEIEAQIFEKAQKYKIRVIGPNCIGVYFPETGIDTLFQSFERLQRPTVGSISYCSQSGTYGVAFLEFAASNGIGIRSFFSYGNRLDVDEGDLLAYFAKDRETKLIGLYVEALDNGRKLVELAKNITIRKPIVLYKAGQTELGARVAVSHTGWVSQSSPEMNKGMFKQAGIILAKTFHQQCAMLKALYNQPPARGPNVAFVSNGAGPVVSAIDLIQESPLHLAGLLPESIEELKEAFPYYFIPVNPVDVTGSATSRDYETTLHVFLKDPCVHICMVYCVFQDTPLDEGIVEVLANASRAGKSLLVCALGGSYSKRMSKRIEMKGIPVFASIDDWVAAAEALYLHGKNLDLVNVDIGKISINP